MGSPSSTRALAGGGGGHFRFSSSITTTRTFPFTFDFLKKHVSSWKFTNFTSFLYRSVTLRGTGVVIGGPVRPAHLFDSIVIFSRAGRFAPRALAWAGAFASHFLGEKVILSRISCSYFLPLPGTSGPQIREHRLLINAEKCPILQSMLA